MAEKAIEVPESSPRSKRRRVSSAGIRIATQMPALHHTLPGQSFDLAKSKVVAWLLRQPEIQNWVFQKANDRKLIIFDPASRTWKGRSR